MAYSLPTEIFLLLEDAFKHDRAKAQIVAKAIEGSIQAIEVQAEQHITDKKETLKSELYNELRTELATKEFVRAELNDVKALFRAELDDVKEVLRSEINELRTGINALCTEINDARLDVAALHTELKQNNLLLKILIGLTVFGLTLFNPAFVKLVELIMK